VDVLFDLLPKSHEVHVAATAKTVGTTGVEMEALTAASVAALTIYDMCKAGSKDLEITQLRLDHKSGGKTGLYQRPGPDAREHT
jgi:cyclic pyranopterin monophosphate synthase